MTRPLQKKIELNYVKELASILGGLWEASPREKPDFIIENGTSIFGLEVSLVHTGEIKKKSSKMKEDESRAKLHMNKLQEAYEAHTNVPLRLHVIVNKYEKEDKDKCKEYKEKILPILIAEDFQSKPVGHRIQKEILRNNGDISIKFCATKALRAEYSDLRYSCGWVNQNGMSVVQNAILEKEKKLDSYKHNTDLKDIRLLLVADHTNNSGKLILENLEGLYRGGFNVIYFFQRPRKIVVFSDEGVQHFLYPEPLE